VNQFVVFGIRILMKNAVSFSNVSGPPVTVWHSFTGCWWIVAEREGTPKSGYFRVGGDSLRT